MAQQTALCHFQNTHRQRADKRRLKQTRSGTAAPFFFFDRTPPLQRSAHLNLTANPFNFRSRIRASGIHFVLSMAVALVAAALVFGIWFPGIYRSIAGGRELFFLIMAVDVVLGPLLTFTVFNTRKLPRHLRRDLGVIGLLQAAALAYGLHVVFLARPVAMVFEVDRLRVINAAQVYLPDLPLAAPGFRALPLMGPWLLSTRTPTAGTEHNEALMMSLNGADRAERPLFWQPYEMAQTDVLRAARPLHLLLANYPAQAEQVTHRLAALGLPLATMRFLPLTARSGDWVAVLDANAKPIHFVPVDGFF